MKNEKTKESNQSQSKWRDAPGHGENVNDGKSKRTARSQKYLQQKEQNEQQQLPPPVTEQQRQLFGQANQAIMNQLYGGTVSSTKS